MGALAFHRPGFVFGARGSIATYLAWLSDNGIEIPVLEGSVLKHFANYIPAGARMLEAIPGDAEVLVLKFPLPDGGVSSILVNTA